MPAIPVEAVVDRIRSRRLGEVFWFAMVYPWTIMVTMVSYLSSLRWLACATYFRTRVAGFPRLPASGAGRGSQHGHRNDTSDSSEGETG
ncbi:MAG: hypothetical protein N2652_07350 [Kiritimatiellae bacterium]|nr:hypothetical protein [Kiritimatiellia bacterium]